MRRTIRKDFAGRQKKIEVDRYDRAVRWIDGSGLLDCLLGAAHRRHWLRVRQRRRWAASLAVLIAAIGVIGLGWIVAEYTRKIQAAGSLYDYVTDGLGSRVGTSAGWLYYAGILALGAGILPLIGGTIHDTILGEFNRQPLLYWAWDVLLLLLVASSCSLVWCSPLACN